MCDSFLDTVVFRVWLISPLHRSIAYTEKPFYTDNSRTQNIMSENPTYLYIKTHCTPSKWEIFGVPLIYRSRIIRVCDRDGLTAVVGGKIRAIGQDQLIRFVTLATVTELISTRHRV